MLTLFKELSTTLNFDYNTSQSAPGLAILEIICYTFCLDEKNIFTFIPRGYICINPEINAGK